jgi:hypothetical protein
MMMSWLRWFKKLAQKNMCRLVGQQLGRIEPSSEQSLAQPEDAAVLHIAETVPPIGDGEFAVS